MLSIITTVYNQAGMNRLFYERLVRNTTLPYELIVVDNGSTDGSLEFFRERADVMIENGANYSYPYCQNRGFARAQYDILVFINNDVLVPRGWDARLLEVMQREKLDAVTPATNDHLESVRARKKLNNRWKRVKYPLRFLFGTGYANLRLMAALTYRNLDRFADERYRRFGTSTVEGFSGSCMVLTRRVMDLMGGGNLGRTYPTGRLRLFLYGQGAQPHACGHTSRAGSARRLYTPLSTAHVPGNVSAFRRPYPADYFAAEVAGA